MFGMWRPVFFLLLVFDEGEVMCHDGRVPWDWSYVAEDSWLMDCCGSVYVNSHIVNNENTKTRGYDNYTFIRMLVTCWFFKGVNQHTGTYHVLCRYVCASQMSSSTRR